MTLNILVAGHNAITYRCIFSFEPLLFFVATLQFSFEVANLGLFLGQKLHLIEIIIQTTRTRNDLD